MEVVKRIAARRRVGERSYWTDVGVVVRNDQGTLKLLVNLMPVDLPNTQLYLVDPQKRRSDDSVGTQAPLDSARPPATMDDDLPF